jgi:hypothetical protein
VAAASLTTPVFDLKVKGKGTRYKSRPVPCDTLGQEWTDCVESKERSGESVGVMGLSSEGGVPNECGDCDNRTPRSAWRNDCELYDQSQR